MEENPGFGDVDNLHITRDGLGLLVVEKTSDLVYSVKTFTSDTEIPIGTLFTFKEGAIASKVPQGDYYYPFVYSSRFYKTTTAGVWDDNYSVLSINAIPYYI